MKKNVNEFLLVLNGIFIIIVFYLIITKNSSLEITEDRLSNWLSIYSAVVTLFTIIAFYNFFSSKNEYEQTVKKYKQYLDSNNKKYIDLHQDIKETVKSYEDELEIIKDLFDFKIVQYDALSNYHNQFVHFTYSDCNEIEIDLEELIGKMHKQIELSTEAYDLSPESERLVALQNLAIVYSDASYIVYRHTEQKQGGKYYELIESFFEEGVMLFIDLLEEDLSMERRGYIGGPFLNNFAHFLHRFMYMQERQKTHEGFQLLIKFEKSMDYTYNFKEKINEVGFDVSNVFLGINYYLVKFLIKQFDEFSVQGKKVILEKYAEMLPIAAEFWNG